MLLTLVLRYPDSSTNLDIPLKNYHLDDQDEYGQNVWGSMMAGLFVGTYIPNFSGLYHDWKMSGTFYNNYADYRVGSPHYPLNLSIQNLY